MLCFLRRQSELLQGIFVIICESGQSEDGTLIIVHGFELGNFCVSKLKDEIIV